MIRNKRIQQHSKIALTYDIPEFGLKQGDIATIVEIQYGKREPDEFLINIVNAVGESVIMLSVREPQIRELRRDEILHVRSYQTAALAEPVKAYKSYPKENPKK